MAEIISISVDKNTAQEIDEIVKKEKFRSRSELVRTALRGFILERKQMEKLSGKVNAILLLSYPCSMEGEIGKMKHEFVRLVNFETHSHIDGMCVHSFSISGDASEVRKMYEHMRMCRKTGYCKMLII